VTVPGFSHTAGPIVVPVLFPGRAYVTFYLSSVQAPRSSRVELFVPGRICLFGEHSDWAAGHRRQNSALEKGHTIITGTNQGLHARVTPHANELSLRSVLPDGTVQTRSVSMAPEALLAEAQAGGFFSYAAGVAYQVRTNWQVGGLAIDNYLTDLPIKKGLSSSAAVCVLVARAFNRLYDLQLTVRGEMDLAYRGEITTPSRCGRMDQGCAFGARPVMMTFDQDIVEVEELSAGAVLHFLIVDLKGAKDTIKILSDLNRSYPFARTPRDREVQEYLGPVNRRIVQAAAQAIEAGDAPGLGALMREAQALFDARLGPSSPEELAAPLLHTLLAYAPLQELVHGGKGVGSQGDGTAQLLCRGPAERERAAALVKAKLGMDAMPLDIRPAQTVTHAVIPAAGFGVELFPASKVVQKELFPIIDRDGVAKPVLLRNIEEANACGLEHVTVVVRPEDQAQLARFFQEPVAPDQAHRLGPHQKPYEKRVLALGRTVDLVPQERPIGLGHAVYCARANVGKRPFVLFLGDYVYQSHADRSCVEQLLDVYARAQRSVVGVKVMPEEALAAAGVVAGTWGEDRRLLEITAVVEKPSVKYAREHLRVPGLPEGKYMGVFGLYVLESAIFEHLETVIKQGLDCAGQYELTVALDIMRGREGCLGYVVEGESYDIGFPDSYLAALGAFRGADRARR
jgi:UTP-glucose-1-phosphate uridylyltransferase/mevalonate kinase